MLTGAAAQEMALAPERATVTFPLLAIALACGLVARRFRLASAGTPDLINAYIINIALPAMILQRVPALELNVAALVPVAFAWLVVLASAALVLLAARYYRWSAAITGALLLTVPLSNSAYLGLPLIGALFAADALPYAILYDQLGNFMALAIYGSIVIAAFELSGRRPSVLGIGRRILTFPPFIFLMIALALPAGALPAWSHGPLALLGASMGPCAMIIIGLQFELAVPTGLRRPLMVGCALKLVVAPALVVAAAMALGLRGPVTQASAMQAAMPPMITAGLLGMAAGFSKPLIVAMIGVATAASALTLPVVYWLVH